VRPVAPGAAASPLHKVNGVKEHAMTRNNADSPKPADDRNARPGEDLSHLPPDLARADVERAKDIEAEVTGPEEPIQQMREGRRKKRRHPTT
jgi:hypothetical protein